MASFKICGWQWRYVETLAMPFVHTSGTNFPTGYDSQFTFFDLHDFAAGEILNGFGESGLRAFYCYFAAIRNVSGYGYTLAGDVATPV